MESNSLNKEKNYWIRFCGDCPVEFFDNKGSLFYLRTLPEYVSF